MLASERPEFENLAKVLCAGFNVPPTPERIEAYWRGCNRMSLITFGRVVDVALEEFESERGGPPTVPQMWNLFRTLRSRVPAADEPKADERRDPVDQFAGRLLLVFTLRKAYPGGDADRGSATSNQSMIALLNAKNKIVSGCRGDEAIARALDTPADDRTPEQAAICADLRDVLIKAFEKHWQPRTEAEIKADADHYARTGRLRGFSDSERAQILNVRPELYRPDSRSSETGQIHAT